MASSLKLLLKHISEHRSPQPSSERLGGFHPQTSTSKVTVTSKVHLFALWRYLDRCSRAESTFLLRHSSVSETARLKSLSRPSALLWFQVLAGIPQLNLRIRVTTLCIWSFLLHHFPQSDLRCFTNSTSDDSHYHLKIRDPLGCRFLICGYDSSGR